MPAVEPFLEPRLTGARFNGGVIPLDVLADLSALEELVVEVAKWKFRRERPNQKRLPRGFADGVALALTGVNEGSARPVIGLMLAAGGLFPPAATQYFHEARAAITSAIAAADHGGPVTIHLPDRYLSYFNRIGRHLRPDEAIEFPTSDDTPPARLTPNTRRRLVLAQATESTVVETLLLHGSITELDTESRSFRFQALDGTRTKGKVSAFHLAAMSDALAGRVHQGMKVLLVGTGRVSRTNMLERIDAVEHVIPLDPRDLTVRFHEFKHLRPGWLDGKGRPPEPAALDHLATSFDVYYPSDLPLPYAYPTAEGGVRMEWTLGPHDISLEIDLATRRGHWHDLRLDTDAEVERGISLDADEDWQWLAGQIRRADEGGG